MLTQAQDGIHGPESLPNLSRKQFYNRMKKARELNLIMKKRTYYRLTAFGELFLDKTKTISELHPTDLLLRTLDAIDDEELRMQAIHEIFNQSPEVEKTLSRQP
jgi:hypothetical protein